MQIEMSEIVCRFGSTPAVAGVDLAVPEGEFLALLGPSGSGKTTLLRIIAGLEKPESGVLRIDGANAVDLAPNKRGIGFVFQHYALFRHMTVARNIAFGLEIRKSSQRPDKAEIDRRVEELLDLVQLPGLGKRFPSQLSGGQRQRVALARALAIEPRILLLDEPFGALDTKVRSELRVWLKSLHRRLGITIVFVTHDQEEAMELADRVAIMRQGRLEQDGNPGAIYADPVSPFVYSFLGAANALPARIEAGAVHAAAGGEILGLSSQPAGAATAGTKARACRAGSSILRQPAPACGCKLPIMAARCQPKSRPRTMPRLTSRSGSTACGGPASFAATQWVRDYLR